MLLSLLLSSVLTFVELNCENLFDCRHDSLKQDMEFLPESDRRWTPARYWRKVNNIAKEILSCSEVLSPSSLPDLVALCEVENDSVMVALTRRSLLRTLRYDYLMTRSADPRGIDVALMYNPSTFRPVRHVPYRVPLMEGMRPTRDILYVSGRVSSGDTLHVLVVHAPSRYGGERRTRPYRRMVMERIRYVVDSVRAISPEAKVIVAGDFNDEVGGESLRYLESGRLRNVTADAVGRNGAKGSYCYKGRWGSIDHVLVTEPLGRYCTAACVNDAFFLLEDDRQYGGRKPHRTYNGYWYQPEGFSDHLPLVVRFGLPRKGQH